MKALIHLKNFTIEIEEETQKELFESISRTQEVFGNDKCYLCGCEELRFVVRRVMKTEGKKQMECTYHEIHCTNHDCRAKLAISQNLTGGTLYPIRKLLPNGQPATGAKAVEGKWKDAGWSRYRGEKNDEASA
jgi:hypothetical protein